MKTDTPETDSLLLEINEGRVSKEDGPTADLCREMERGRNYNRSSLKRALSERDALETAVKKLRDSKGRHHSEIAHRELYALLLENH